MTSLSVVIPAYNEEAALGDVLQRCMEILPRCTTDFDITIVNDASIDGTPGIVAELQSRFPSRILVIHHPVRLGMAATFEDAYRSGTKEYVVLLHADGQYPPEILLECVKALPHSAIVLMTRKKKFYGPYRHLLSWGYRAIPRLLFGIDLHDPGCSKCIRRDLIETIPILSTGIFAEAERVIRAIRAGYSVTFLPVESAPRAAGVAQGGSAAHALEAFRDIVKVWWTMKKR